jgi:hypothetical protein
MKIINLTPHEITVFASSDVKPAGQKGYALARANAEPIYRFPSRGMSRASACETPLKDCMGIPVFSMTYGDPEGVPEWQEGVMLIVSALTAQACKHAGRRTDDLLTTARVVRDTDGRIIGCSAFAML